MLDILNNNYVDTSSPYAVSRFSNLIIKHLGEI